MSVDMFLKIEGVKGESQDDSHKGEIDVLSWNWGMTQSGTTHMGAGGGSGKVSVQDLSITKYVDSASPAIMQKCCNGSHFPEATLTVRKAGGSPVEYVKIKMKEVLISSVSSGGNGDMDRVTENITLNFSWFEHTYTEQTEDGSAGASIPTTWDIKKNVS